MDVYHLVFIHCLKYLKEYIRQISLTYSLETKFILWYEETVFVREPFNGLLRVIFSPGPGFNAPCPYLMMMMMMYLAWGLNRERGGDLDLADSGLGLSCSGSDVGGHKAPEGGAGGPGPWLYTLSPPITSSREHLSYVTNIGDPETEATDIRIMSQVPLFTALDKLGSSLIENVSQSCWGHAYDEMWQVSCVTWRSEVGWQQGLRQYNPGHIEDIIVLSSNHKVTSATSYKMTSRVSSQLCDGAVPCHHSVIMDQVPPSWHQHCHGPYQRLLWP